MEDAGSVGIVFVRCARRSELICDQRTGQTVAPYRTQRLVVECVAHVGSYSDRKRKPFDAVGAKDCNRLQNTVDRNPACVERRIGDGQDFTRECRIGRDQVTEPAQWYVFLVGQLQNTDSDQRKGRNAKMGPGDPDCLVTLACDQHAFAHDCLYHSIGR